MNEEQELKAAFAALLLEHEEPFKAALIQFPTEKFAAQKALRVAMEWPKDPFVIEALKKLKESNAALAFLPDEAKYAKEVWETAQSAFEHKDRIAALKLYGEIRGYIKNNSKIDANIKTSNIVQVVATPLDEQL